MPTTLSLITLLHDDATYLPCALASFRGEWPMFAFVSRVPWHATPGDWEAAAVTAGQAGAEVVLGDWPSEEVEHGYSG